MLPQESLAGFDATRATYEKMIDLKIVTPQVRPPQSRPWKFAAGAHGLGGLRCALVQGWFYR
jgi:hypothetical protein